MHYAEDSVDALSLPFWGGLGIVFLMANDHLHFGLTSAKGAPADPLKVLTELVPVSEYSGVNGFEHKVARSRQMIGFVAPTMRQDPRFVDVEHDFRQCTGMALATFQALTFGALTKYLLLDAPSYLEDPARFYLLDEYFRTTAVSPDDVRAFLDTVATSLDELKARIIERDSGATDFTWFRDKPL